jgi:hypothetical protein
MCGLVGLVNKQMYGFTKEHQEVFSTLLFLDFLRGSDSTGVFGIHNDGDVLLAKEASNPLDFMKTEAYDNIMQKSWTRGNALIGHNRKATRGVVNDENAHPFVVDDKIVLVHNGTMYGDHKKMADVEVDSHAIAHVIHEKNGDVASALSSFDAAYALIWYDFERATLNFVRNMARPLWWMETSTAYIWSSEKCMLDFVKARHSLTVRDGPTELTPDLLQIFTLGRNGGWASSSQKLEIKKAPIVTYGSNYTPAHSTVQKWLGMRGRQGRHPYENDPVWGGEDYDDANFQDPVGAAVQEVVAPPKQAALLLPSPSTGLTTSEFERVMAKKMNKVITHAQYEQDVVKRYTHGESVTCMAFDYCYANQKDSTGGYYLYTSIVDDPDVIVRHYFEERYTTEERVVQIASGEYVYRYRVGRKRWEPFMTNVPLLTTTPGFVIIEGEHAILVDNGTQTFGFEGKTH